MLNSYGFLKFVTHVRTHVDIFYVYVGVAITVLNVPEHRYSRQNTEGLIIRSCMP